MKKIYCALLAALVLTAYAEAILPPLYQTSDEIKALLSTPQLGQKLQSGEPIMEIKKNETGYLIITNQHHLQVNIEYKPLERPGPAQFDFQFQEAVPL